MTNNIFPKSNVTELNHFDKIISTTSEEPIEEVKEPIEEVKETVEDIISEEKLKESTVKDDEITYDDKEKPLSVKLDPNKPINTNLDAVNQVLAYNNNKHESSLINEPPVTYKMKKDYNLIKYIILAVVIFILIFIMFKLINKWNTTRILNKSLPKKKVTGGTRHRDKSGRFVASK